LPPNIFQSSLKFESKMLELRNNVTLSVPYLQIFDSVKNVTDTNTLAYLLTATEALQPRHWENCVETANAETVTEILKL
jgi:hypothetical protein